MKEKRANYQLFKYKFYYLFPQVESHLEKSDACSESYLTDRVTHVIADEDDHPEISEARDLFELPVVTVSFYNLYTVLSLQLNLIACKVQKLTEKWH